MPCRLSTFKWIKYRNYQPIQVQTSSSSTISHLSRDFLIEMSPELSDISHSRITIQQDSSSNPFNNNQLSSSIQSGNTAKDPLIVKIIDSKHSKRIFIQDIDEKFRPIHTFKMFTVECDSDVELVMGTFVDFLCRANNTDCVIEPLFKNLQDGLEYRVFSRYYQSRSDRERWKIFDKQI